MKKIILASASPRRKDLMSQAGFEFEVCVSTQEEKMGDWSPRETVKQLAMQKAWDVGKQFDEDCIIIGADTVVACKECILGKPKDEEDAVRMLQMLQGQTHQVYTGVTILDGPMNDRKQMCFAEKTDVTMYPMTEAMIRAYIAGGEPMDKAGAYGIQGQAAVFVKEIHGDYNNVVGLPIAAVWQYLMRSGK